MKEETERERLEQLEQEEIERQKRYSNIRRSSSPAMRQSQVIDTERSAHSEPIPPHTQFVSFLGQKVFRFCTQPELAFSNVDLSSLPLH